MSPAADLARHEAIVGINWGSTNFRAYLIDPDGALRDVQEAPAGVTTLDRAGMAELLAACIARWGHRGAIYASGMIGSNVGWIEAPYVLAPATLIDLAAGLVSTTIGGVAVSIVPGIACRRVADDAPDILRGEEIELFGMMKGRAGEGGCVALPGTHTKWVRLAGDRVAEFLTSMSGEIYDRLTGQGLLASIVADEASVGDAFGAGVDAGAVGTPGLAALLFGARARVMRGDLPRSDASSYLRGILIGAEIAGAAAVYPEILAEPVTLVGNAPLGNLYGAALARRGRGGVWRSSQDACVCGYLALHRSAPVDALRLVDRQMARPR